MVDQEYSTEPSGLAELHAGPGVLILTLSGQLQYMNRRSWDFLRLISESTCIRTSGSVLPHAVTEICRHIHQLRRPESTMKNCEQIEIRHIVGGPEQPVLLRGIGLPGQDRDHARVLIMMETVARRDTSTRHAKERFQLTEREQNVVERLAKGWTNKVEESTLSYESHPPMTHVERYPISCR